MSDISLVDLWRKRYGQRDEATDYSGRKMMLSAHTNPKSNYQPTLDHVRPLSNGGRDIEANIEICNRQTNAEKADRFPCWTANGKRFCAKKRKGVKDGYYPEEVKD